MQTKIADIREAKIQGVRVYFPPQDLLGGEAYFKWEESMLTARFETNEVSGGTLTSWHHALEFTEAEYHEDEEMFYFLSGTAIMLFVDLCGDGAKMDTVQVVRVPAGTQLVIEKGKGHFVAIAENNDPVHMIVVAPKMAAPRVSLAEKVQAIRG